MVERGNYGVESKIRSKYRTNQNLGTKALNFLDFLTKR